LLKWLHELFLSVNLIRESSLQVIYFILVSCLYLRIKANKIRLTRKYRLHFMLLTSLMRYQKQAGRF